MLTQRSFSTLAAAVAAIICTGTAHAVTLLGPGNVSYSGQNILSIDGLNFQIATPDSFTLVGNGTTVRDISNGSTIGPTYIGPPLQNPGFLTDLDVSTGVSFNDAGTPTLDANLASGNELVATAGNLTTTALILFESGGNDTPTVQAFDSTGLIGTPFTVTAWGDTGVSSTAVTTNGQTSAAVGLSLADLGVLSGQQVTGFHLSTLQSLDATEVLVNANLRVQPEVEAPAVPEPATLTAVLLAGAALTLRRRATRA